MSTCVRASFCFLLQSILSNLVFLSEPFLLCYVASVKFSLLSVLGKLGINHIDWNQKHTIWRENVFGGS